MNRITTNRSPFKKVSVLKSILVRSSAIHCASRKGSVNRGLFSGAFCFFAIAAMKSILVRSSAIHCASRKGSVNRFLFSGVFCFFAMFQTQTQLGEK